jgi:phosphoenolpyruvate carboxykinase (GTP)
VTPIGLVPPVGSDGIDVKGVEVSDEDMGELLRVDAAEWQAQLPRLQEHYAKFERLPAELYEQLRALEERLTRQRS